MNQPGVRDGNETEIETSKEARSGESGRVLGRFDAHRRTPAAAAS